MITHKFICWINGWIWAIKSGFAGSDIATSGHHYKWEEEHENCKVTIMTCEVCGHVDISWEKNNGLTTSSFEALTTKKD